MNLLHPFSIITSPAPRAVTDVTTFPSHPRLMVGFHLGQVTSLSQGHIETNFYAHSHTYSSTLCCLSVYCNMHVFGLRHRVRTPGENPQRKTPSLGIKTTTFLLRGNTANCVSIINCISILNKIHLCNFNYPLKKKNCVWQTCWFWDLCGNQ